MCVIQLEKVKNLRQFFDIQNVFTKIDFLIESSMYIFKLLFEINFHFKHNQIKRLNRYMFSILKQYRLFFLNSQINDAIFMLQRICDVISVNTNRFLNNDVIATANFFRSIQIYEKSG